MAHDPDSGSSRTHVSHDVILWRRARLADAGFGPGLAGELAADSRYDLHELLGLIDRNCPPVLAARILAPI